MSKLTIRDTRCGLVYESHYQQNSKNKIIKYLESNNDDDEFIVLIDGYVAGELSSEQYDEFKYMFHLHPKKIAEESSIDVCDEFEYQEREKPSSILIECRSERREQPGSSYEPWGEYNEHSPAFTTAGLGECQYHEERRKRSKNATNLYECSDNVYEGEFEDSFEEPF